MGHASRLARKGITDAVMFGSHEYYLESAIIPSAFLEEAIRERTLARRAGRGPDNDANSSSPTILLEASDLLREEKQLQVLRRAVRAR